MNLIGKSRRFLRLPREERRLFLEAWLTLGVMRAALLTRPFKELTRSLGQSATPQGFPGFEGPGDPRALRIGTAVRRAAAHTPWESACLVQALTVWKMLERRGIPGLFYLGVRRGEAGETMAAHAWSQSGEAILTGAAGRERFVVVSVFGWGENEREEVSHAENR